VPPYREGSVFHLGVFLTPMATEVGKMKPIEKFYEGEKAKLSKVISLFPRDLLEKILYGFNQSLKSKDEGIRKNTNLVLMIRSYQEVF
jgi:hypothetical protein